jgi:hypothetical protein
MVIGKAVFISQRNPFFRMLKSTRNRQNQKKVTISYAFPGISCFFSNGIFLMKSCIFWGVSQQNFSDSKKSNKILCDVL